MRAARTQMWWVFAASVGLMGLTLLPYLLHASHPQPGRSYTGLERYVNDQISYLMWTNQVRNGHLTVSDLFVQDLPERFAPNPLWAALGLMARVLPFSTVALYHAARFVLGVAYLVALFAFLRMLSPEPRIHWTAWLLAATGGGFAWLWWLKTGETGLAGLRASADYMPETWSFSSLQYFPHFAASLLLMVACLAHLVAGFRGRPALAALSGLWLGLLVLIHTYTAVTILAVTATLVALWRLLARTWRPVVGPCALMLAVSVPFFAGQAWEVKSHQTLRLWSESNQMPSPHPGSYVMGFGAVGLAAALGMLRQLKTWSRQAPLRTEDMLVLSWVVATVALLYCGASFERRCVEGLHIPLALLAARFLAHTMGHTPARAMRLAAGAFVVLCLPTSVWYVARDLSDQQGYIPTGILAAEAAAFDLYGEGARVFCSGYFGQWLPMQGRVRVYIGHAQLTFHRAERQATVKRFFAASTPDTERLRILQRSGCQLVLAGGEERAVLDAAPRMWRRVAGDNTVRLYVPQDQAPAPRMGNILR